MPTLRTAWGFESGSIGELVDATGSDQVAFVTSPAPPRPGHTYVAEFGSGSDAEAATALWPNADDKHAIACWIRFSNTSPSPNWAFATIRESKGVDHLYLWIADGGILRLLDRKADTIGESSTGMLQPNTWHLIKLLYTHGDPGAVIVYVDKAKVFDVSGEDFDAGGLTNDLQFYLDSQGGGGLSPCTMRTWGGYVRSGCSDITDFYPDTFELFGYQNRGASATPDIGQDLDAGQWNDCGEAPFNDVNYGKYTGKGDKGVVTTDSSDGGMIPGPYGDPRIADDEYIVGATWLFRIEAPLMPIGNSIAVHYGKTPYGDPDVDNTSTESIGKVTVPAYYLIVSEADADVPKTGHYAQYGFSGDGAGGHGRAVTLFDAQVCILYCPPSSVQLERGMARGVGRGNGRGIF